MTSLSTPFRNAGALLYDGPFVAERLVTAGRILAERPDALLHPLRAIFEAASRLEARAVFEAEHKLAVLRRRAGAALATVDLMVVPTTPTIYKIDEVLAEPGRLNATLGTYTNFVNLLDRCGVAVPGGFRADGLPAGVTLVGTWGRDAYLASSPRRCTERPRPRWARPERRFQNGSRRSARRAHRR